MAAKQPGLHQHRVLPAPGAKSGPVGACRQQRAQVGQRRRCRIGAVLDAQHDLEQRRVGQRAIGNQVVGQMNVAAVKHFQLGQGAGFACQLRHDAHIARRVDDHRGAGEHGVQIQAADLGLQGHHVFHASLGCGQRGAGCGHLGVVLARHKTLARAGGQVDDDVGIAGPHALHHFAVVLQFHARAAIRIAHVNVRNGGAGLGCADAGVGNLFRRAGQVRVLLDVRDVAGDGAADDGGVAHDVPSL